MPKRPLEGALCIVVNQFNKKNYMEITKQYIESILSKLEKEANESINSGFVYRSLGALEVILTIYDKFQPGQLIEYPTIHVEYKFLFIKFNCSRKMDYLEYIILKTKELLVEKFD